MTTQEMIEQTLQETRGQGLKVTLLRLTDKFQATTKTVSLPFLGFKVPVSLFIRQVRGSIEAQDEVELQARARAVRDLLTSVIDDEDPQQ